MIKKINISIIKNNKLSIKEEDLFKFIMLKKSIETYGQLRPIILSSSNEIIDGHKLYEALLNLSIKEVDVIILNIDKPLEQTYIELNTLFFENNPVKSIKYFSLSDLDKNCIPYSRKDQEDYRKLLQFNWDTYKEKEKPKAFF